MESSPNLRFLLVYFKMFKLVMGDHTRERIIVQLYVIGTSESHYFTIQMFAINLVN